MRWRKVGTPHFPLLTFAAGQLSGFSSTATKKQKQTLGNTFKSCANNNTHTYTLHTVGGRVLITQFTPLVCARERAQWMLFSRISLCVSARAACFGVVYVAQMFACVCVMMIRQRCDSQRVAQRDVIVGAMCALRDAHVPRSAD